MTRPWTYRDIPDLTGKLALVTGANSGLGLHTTRGLAARGATVVMACRDAAKAQAAMQQICAEVPGAQLEMLALDLADLASVRRCADSVIQRHDRLDLLCNNAGVMALPRRVTCDGFEMQVGTNHLGHFALTGLLLPLLKRSPAARVVTVSSLAYLIGRIRFDDFGGARFYAKWPAYAQSKLANLMFALELARRLPGSSGNVISTAAHPGYAATHLQMVGPQMENSAVGKLLMTLSNALFAQPAEMGALPTLFAATAPGVGNGAFFGPNGFLRLRGAPTSNPPSRRARDPAVAERLWTLSERLTGVSYLSA
ncbi:oxidoreductase [Caldimonas brevitalea]|uniref:Short-chain dehydrogenase n=1 Tax=Caldimonas brevitalea TaxID=413882 RepID=A0A0G3BCN5_9BURK|nr:oxidoreductase [Caldimonas brevitalea]AKJ27134.1 short-chain dehydrogenase [Caldimonas brevitalea]